MHVPLVPRLKIKVLTPIFVTRDREYDTLLLGIIACLLEDGGNGHWGVIK